MQSHVFNLTPSRQYLAVLFIALLISIITCVQLPLAYWRTSLLIMTIAVYGGVIIWRHGFLRSENSIVALHCYADGHWMLATRDQQYEAELQGDSTVTGLISILRFRIKGRLLPVSCVVLRDSLPTDQYRKLLVALKTQGP